MTSKHVLFRAEAREKILRGVTALADAVRVTLGPRSKCVLIEKSGPFAAAGLTDKETGHDPSRTRNDA